MRTTLLKETLPLPTQGTINCFDVYTTVAIRGHQMHKIYFMIYLLYIKTNLAMFHMGTYCSLEMHC